MIIQLASNVSQVDIDTIKTQVEQYGYKSNYISTQLNNYLICIGKKAVDLRKIGHLDGIQDIWKVSDTYKLVSTKWKVGKTAIDLGDGIKIGNGDFQIMAGPCSIESEEQIINTIEALKANNIKIMRGGVYKPRTSPYSFRGVGMDGLKTWHKHASAAGIKIITEVMQVSQIAEMHDYVDIFQVGARNSQNFNLLDELGRIDKPVMIKRGISGTIEELLQSAEYVFSNGNEKILLCERGIRSFEKAYRNTMDINAIAILKDKSHLPVIADPSHGVGVRKYVDKIAKAATVAGADGVILEIHETPQKAFSDGQQTLDYREAKRLFEALRTLRSINLN